MYGKVLFSSFHKGKIKLCMTFGSGDIEEKASAFFLQSLYLEQNFSTSFLVSSVSFTKINNSLFFWKLVFTLGERALARLKFNFVILPL